jgi:hypothetical protein
MSSLAFPREAAPGRAPRRSVAAWIAEHPTEALISVPIAVLAFLTLVQLPKEFNVDSWLALVTGRLVWQQGVPHHEILTAMSLGHGWVDQQWLAQLVMYAIYRIGGIGLMGLVNGVLITSSVVIATVTARRLGAARLPMLVCLAACLAMVMPSREIRTQGFALPLFALLAYLLVIDGRRPSRRVFWCLPILVLWANLHGTATLGAGLVVLRGLVSLWEDRSGLRSERASWLRPLALILGAVAAILITPYGLGIVGYYHDTMVSSTLRQAVTEWRPVTSVPATAVALFAMTGLALWSFGRSAERTTTWEKLALLILAVGAISVVRNAVFFALLALMIVPVSLSWGDRAKEGASDRRRAWINGTLAFCGVVAVVFAAASTLLRPASGVEYSEQRPGVLTAVETAVRTHPGIRVMADEALDDWLLWRDPGLSGRVGNDVRFEILSDTQIRSLQAFFQMVGPDWKAAARGYRLLALYRKDEPAAFAALRRERGARTLYYDGQREVILRSPAQTRSG